MCELLNHYIEVKLFFYLSNNNNVNEHCQLLEGKPATKK